jgi:hypothetical protein
MKVNGQFHAPAALPPGESAPCTHWMGSLVGPSVDLDAVEKKTILHCRDSSPGNPSRSPLLYRLSYRDSAVKSSRSEIMLLPQWKLF